MILAAAQHSSTSVWSTLGGLGVGAVLGAAIAALITGLLTGRRERTAARRAWLGEALANFYGPVSAKLEMYYEWNRRLWQEQEAMRDNEGELRITEDEMAVLQRAVQSNVKLRREVQIIVEGNLHYVDEPEMRELAIAYLADGYMDDWKCAAIGADEALEAGKGMVIVTEPERTRFIQLVSECFEAKGREFRELSGGKP